MAQIIKNQWIIRAIIPSLIFNLKHLPLQQAIKIPILLYKAKIINNTGRLTLNMPVKFGMIRLGVNIVSLFPNNGITLENRGHIIFNGRTTIGNNSAISLGETGQLEFGDNFIANTGLKIACYNSIKFDDNVLIGWNTQIIDTDFHLLKKRSGQNVSKGFGPIHIGHNVWIANGCRIYKNVTIPHSCVVGADTILRSHFCCPPNSLITNNISTEIKASGLYYDCKDDQIKYETAIPYNHID